LFTGHKDSTIFTDVIHRSLPWSTQTVPMAIERTCSKLLMLVFCGVPTLSIVSECKCSQSEKYLLARNPVLVQQSMRSSMGQSPLTVPKLSRF